MSFFSRPPVEYSLSGARPNATTVVRNDRRTCGKQTSGIDSIERIYPNGIPFYDGLKMILDVFRRI